MRNFVCLAGIALLLVGCGGPPTSSTQPHAQSRARHASPKLVVCVVLDQWPSDSFLRWQGAFSRDAFFADAREQGHIYERARYAYAATMTAAGHAAIYTGLPPRESGVASNRTWDPEREKVVSIVDDGTHRIFGREDAFASPLLLRAPTLGDRLKEATGEGAKVVSLSMKDRSAVISGGRKADVAAFFDIRTGNFVTSNYYGQALPAWIEEFNSRRTYRDFARVWEPFMRTSLVLWAGVDDAPGEGDWNGLGRTFPHSLESLTDPAETFLATPFAASLLFELAQSAVEAYELGTDDIPDLLMISISSTDYIGHVFGPLSWESLDAFIRVDYELAEFWNFLQDRVGSGVRFIVTSDHGASPLVESLREREIEAFRIEESHLRERAESAIDAALGENQWTAAYDHPYLYLTDRAQERRAEAISAAKAALRAVPGVRAVFDAKARPMPCDEPEALCEMIRASLSPMHRGDLYVLFESGTSIDERMPGHSGSSHGTPYPHDTDVPLIVFPAPDSEPRLEHRPVPQSTVTRVLADALGLEN